MRFRWQAFTLVEILVTVTIIAIAAAIVIPSLGSGQDVTRVSAATRVVMADLAYAQNFAITSQKTTYVYFYNGDPTASAANGIDVSTKNTSGTINSTDCIVGPDNSPLRVRFGPGQADPFTRTQLAISTTPKITGGSAIAVLSFNSLGEPQVSSTKAGTFSAPTNTVEIAITNRAGNTTTKLILQPYTGEISLQ